MLFKEVLDALILAEKAKDEAKERWLDLNSAADDGQFEARRAFLSADESFAALAQRLIAELGNLRSTGLIELVIDALNDDLKLQFHRLVGRLEIEPPLQPQAPASLEELVAAWRASAALLDAATRINQLRFGCEPDQFEAVLNDSQSWRNPAAWENAVSAYRLIMSNSESQEADLEERMGDATHIVLRHARRTHDRLTEQLRDMLEDLVERNMLGSLLEDMEPNVRRCVQEMAGSGFLRQRLPAPQPQPQPHSKSVITLPQKGMC